MGRREKVLFFLSNLNGGGAQRTVINILSHLSREKFEIKLALLDYNKNHPYADLVPKDVPIININRRGRYAIWKIGRLLIQEKPTVIFSTLPQVNIAVSLSHKLTRSPAKLILRETTHRSRQNMSWLQYKLIRAAYSYSDKVIALTNGVRNEMIDMYRLSPEKVITIYNPINIEEIEVKSLVDLENTSPSAYHDKIKLIACGRLVPLKNFDLLIRALANVEKTNDKWVLTILGEGPEKERLEKLTKEVGLADKITFLGFKKNPYTYMKHADVFILTSKWEGFGHVIVEAMACSTPVLATNCPYGPQEILDGGKYGWIVENNHQQALEKKIIDLLQNPQEIKAAQEKVYQRAMNYDVKKIISDYERVLQNI